MISVEKGLFRNSIALFDVCVRKVLREQDFQVEEEVMENDSMDAEGSLHQKPRDDCIAEDNATIDLVWFEKHKVESCEKRQSMFVAGWRSLFGITWCISVDDSKTVL